MVRVSLTLLVCLMCGRYVLGAPAPKERPATAESEVKKLEGTWTVISFSKDGEEVPAGKAKMATMTFKDGEATLLAGEKKEAGKFKLDPSRKPHEMDWIGKGGEDRPTLFIYELDGDNLKLCWRKPGGKRPTEFTAKDIDGLMILKKK